MPPLVFVSVPAPLTGPVRASVCPVTTSTPTFEPSATGAAIVCEPVMTWSCRLPVPSPIVSVCAAAGASV